MFKTELFVCKNTRLHQRQPDVKPLQGRAGA